MIKYALYCNQRSTYFGGGVDIEDTSHFNSLEEIKETLIYYHRDIPEEVHKLLYKWSAGQIADMFDWEIYEVNKRKS